MSNDLTFQKTEFQKLLSSLSKLSDLAIFTVTKDGIQAICNSADRMVYVRAFLKGNYDFETTLNFPSLGKLYKLIDLVKEDEIVMKRHLNHLEYKGSKVKFKYHLHEDGVITAPKLSIEKIDSFKFDVEFDVDSAFLADLRTKLGKIRAKKVYIYTENGHIVWSFEDRTVANTDSLTIIGDATDVEFGQYIITDDTFKTLELVKDSSVTFKFNTKMKVGGALVKQGDLELTYILPSLVN